MRINKLIISRIIWMNLSDTMLRSQTVKSICEIVFLWNSRIDRTNYGVRSLNNVIFGGHVETGREQKIVSGVLRMFFFFIWVLVTQMCLLFHDI